jgi:DNA-binding response OmpR family regulator
MYKHTKNNAQQNEMTYGDLTIFLNMRTATCKGNDFKLTKNEFKWLVYMLKNQSRAVSREELLTNIWRNIAPVNSRVVDDLIKRLRRKLLEAQSNVTIVTVWGYGFRLEAHFAAEVAKDTPAS